MVIHSKSSEPQAPSNSPEEQDTQPSTSKPIRSRLPGFRTMGAQVNDPSFPPTTPEPPPTKLWRLRLLRSYAWDWAVTIGVSMAFFALDKVHGFKRRFSLNDETIQYPFTEEERVPYWLCVFLVFVVPFVTMPGINYLSIRSWWDVHNSWLGLVLSFGLTGAITNIIKNTVGRPRPDLIARCMIKPGSENEQPYGLVDVSICTQPDFGILNDGFRSFISGHSSTAFAGLGFYYFYIAGKLHLFDKRGHAAKAWIAFAPLVGATLIAVTRTMDYRHHWQDVFIGSLVGFVVSHYSYRQYYPPLNHPYSHRPYSPRVPREEAADTKPSTASTMQQAAPHQASSSATAQTLPHPVTAAPRRMDSGETSPSSEHHRFGVDDTLQREQPPSLHALWKEGHGEGGSSRPKHSRGNSMV